MDNLNKILSNYIKFKVELDPLHKYFRLVNLQSSGTGRNIISDLVDVSEIRSYHLDVNYSMESEHAYTIGYDIYYQTSASIRFVIDAQIHNTAGWVESSFNTRDCILFKADQASLFEVFVFQNQEYQSSVLFDQFILCEFDEALGIFVAKN